MKALTWASLTKSADRAETWGCRVAGSLASLSREERAWETDTEGTTEHGECPSTWQEKDGNAWICSLRVGHPGDHIGGYWDGTCGARWWEDPYLGLEIGPALEGDI